MKNSSRNKSKVLLSVLTVVLIGVIFYAAITRYRVDLMIVFSVLAIVCMIGYAIVKIKVMQDKKNEYMMTICQIWAEVTDNDIK